MKKTFLQLLFLKYAFKAAVFKDADKKSRFCNLYIRVGEMESF